MQLVHLLSVLGVLALVLHREALCLVFRILAKILWSLLLGCLAVLLVAAVLYNWLFILSSLLRLGTDLMAM
jgi:hypothetical protein